MPEDLLQNRPSHKHTGMDSPKIKHSDTENKDDDDHTQYILADGTRAFTGDQSMGSNKITNLATPSADADAATKALVEARYNSLKDIADDELFISAAGCIVENSASHSSYPAGAANFAIIKCTDGGTADIFTTIKIPSGMTGIQNIKVIYSRDSTGNLYLVFQTSHLDLTSGDAIVNDQEDSLSAYAGGAADNSLGLIEVPSIAYDGMTIGEDDLFGIQCQRAGGNANDTYNADWIVYGFLFTFTNTLP